MYKRIFEDKHNQKKLTIKKKRVIGCFQEEKKKQRSQIRSKRTEKYKSIEANIAECERVCAYFHYPSVLAVPPLL